jgi:hypothetical protein
MNRSEALRAGYACAATIAGLTSAGDVHQPTRLADFAFALGLGSGRGLGVLFGSPEIVVENDRGEEKRLIVPRATGEPGRWNAAAIPAQLPGTHVDTRPGNDVRYGYVLDRATGLCGGPGGAYLAMLAFPTLPYLVYYNADREHFRTFALPSSQAVIGLFVQPPRLYYIRAGAAELRSVEIVDPNL